jgi:xanthine/CO dehydrogenase XdhC/CoxF family maturation factor
MLLAEAFLRKSIEKAPFTVKTVLELVAILKLESGQSRDSAAIVKCIRDLYASDFVKAHIEKLPAAQRERLNTLVSTGLDQFVELAHDAIPMAKTTAACMPLLCGGVAPVMVEPLSAAPKNAAAAAAVEEKMIVAATEPATAAAMAVVTEVAAVVATTQEVILEVKDTLAQAAGAADTQPSVAPSSETVETVATTDVSGAPLDATPEKPLDTVVA